MTASVPITQDVMTIPRKLPDGPINLVGLTRTAMREVLIAHGTPEKQAKMRVGQIWQWLYQWGVRDFALMTNLAKAYRAELAETFVIEIPEIVTKQVSTDGTRKFLWRRLVERPGSTANIESVLIPDKDRITYCISTQAGCPVKCTFCATGYGGFRGQLSAVFGSEPPVDLPRAERPFAAPGAQTLEPGAEAAIETAREVGGLITPGQATSHPLIQFFEGVTRGSIS